MMKNKIIENFLKWSKSISLNNGVAAATISEDNLNRSARVDFDGFDNIGRITVWSDGSFLEEVISIKTEMTIYEGSGELLGNENFDLKFFKILSFFKKEL